MKTLLLTSFRRFTLPVIVLLGVQLAEVNPVRAQLTAPLCDGTTMYAIFNDSIGSTSTVHKGSEIHAVSFATGTVSATLMGLTTFTFQKTLGGTTYYGSASLGADATRFYVNTQMGNAGPKDILAVSTSAANQKVIATTPTSTTLTVNAPVSLDDYHFVKMAVNKAGTFGYMLGVLRDTTLAGYTAATCNPLIKFSTCGTTGCSTITMLGYLQSTPAVMTNWQLFNGDIAFDLNGNLYFATAAYAYVNGAGRYTNSRLFRIPAATLPTTVGTGVIPMVYVGDYPSLDSTVLDGIAFDAVGAMYLATRRYNGVQGAAGTTFQSQLYKSTIVGAATLMPAFTSPTAGYTISDLASCSFPLTTLAANELDLTGAYSGGYTNLSWTVNDNTNVIYYEVQSSTDGLNFSTIARLDPQNTSVADARYIYSDPQSGYGPPKYYRVREMMNTGMRLYSQVITVIFNTKLSLLGNATPNPFIDHVNVDVQLKAANTITGRLVDQSGKIVYQRSFSGQQGENKITLNGMLHLSAGMYIMEIAVDGETARQKLVKQQR